MDFKNVNITDRAANTDYETTSTMNKKAIYIGGSEKPNSMTMNIEPEKKNLEKYEMVSHPKHYNLYDVEAVDMIAKIYGVDFMPKFCEATALLYRLRLGLKPENSVEQELGKEKWWLNKRDEYKKSIENKEHN